MGYGGSGGQASSLIVNAKNLLTREAGVKK